MYVKCFYSNQKNTSNIPIIEPQLEKISYLLQDKNKSNGTKANETKNVILFLSKLRKLIKHSYD